MYNLASMRSWLEDAATSHSPPLAQCVLFGSILNSSQPADVDVVLVSNEWYIQNILTEMRLNFVAEFRLPLHLQLFHISQVEAINKFLNRAGKIEILL
ncbi:hypothetical protein ACLB0R_08635 [Sphingomonas sp. GlSt437]|uniref:hypothetical protein n=1 Tax=Sphingomonas sp. GlSt437 TaxID=3389970 RepID=UPI003EBD17DB